MVTPLVVDSAMVLRSRGSEFKSGQDQLPRMLVCPHASLDFKASDHIEYWRSRVSAPNGAY